MRKSVLLALLLGLSVSRPSPAMDGAAVEIGKSEDDRMARVSARWNWDKRWNIGKNWNAGGFWEADLGRWEGTRHDKQTLWELGITPVFRLRPNGSAFFLEGGVGAHWLSKTRIDHWRKFGQHINFGSHFGMGWNFGEKQRYELGYRFQHLSNANLADPNSGINFHSLSFGYAY